MWDLFKGILGIPRQDQRPFDTFDRGWQSTIGISENDHEEDSEVDGFQNQPFSVFTDPLEMHKYFEQQFDNMIKRVFPFSSISQIPWTDEGLQVQSEASNGSLRDQFLKPGISENTGKDSDLDGQIGTNDIQTFADLSRQPVAKAKMSTPHFFSRSVVVRSVRRPDGSVETVRTERDHTGREETTVTKEGPETCDRLPIEPNNPQFPSLSGEDLFSKFFS